MFNQQKGTKIDLGIVERVNRDLLKTSSTDNINISKRDVWYEPHQIRKHLTMWTHLRMKNTRKWSPWVLSVITWKRFQKAHMNGEWVISPLPQCTPACN